MKRQEFSIACNGKHGRADWYAEVQKGYIYKVGDFFFGINGKSGNWRVTELTSGTYCFGGIQKLDMVADSIVDWLKKVKVENVRKAINCQKRFDPDYKEYEVVLMADWSWYS